MHSNIIERYKRTLRLSRRQRSIIVGTLLGDGHLETRDRGMTYRLKIEHSLKQKEYVDWLYQEFRPWIGQPPRMRLQHARFPQGTEGQIATYGFTTYSHPSFRFYGQQFYTKDGKKIIPKMIRKLLDPLALAIWYLDDGSFKSNRHRTFILHTHGYQARELGTAQQALAMLGITTRLHQQKRVTGRYWRVYVLSESAPQFLAHVAPIVKQIPTMMYKLGNIVPKR